MAKSRLYQLLKAAIIATNLILLIVVSVLTLEFYRQRPCRRRAGLTRCVPRRAISLSEDEDYDNLRALTYRGGDRYCATTDDQLKIISQAFVEHKIRNRRTEGGTDRMPENEESYYHKPSACIFGVTTTGSTSKEENMLHWNVNTSLSFLKELTYNNGRMMVDTAGLYHVYASVTFDTPKKLEASKKYSVFIYKHSNTSFRKPVQVLQSVQSKCMKPLSQAMYTLYTSGVLSLEKGDCLYVKAKNVDAVVPDMEANHFGMHMI